MGMFRRLNDLVIVKFLKQCLAHSTPCKYLLYKNKTLGVFTYLDGFHEWEFAFSLILRKGYHREPFAMWGGFVLPFSPTLMAGRLRWLSPWGRVQKVQVFGRPLQPQCGGLGAAHWAVGGWGTWGLFLKAPDPFFESGFQGCSLFMNLCSVASVLSVWGN